MRSAPMPVPGPESVCLSGRISDGSPFAPHWRRRGYRSPRPSGRPDAAGFHPLHARRDGRDRKERPLRARMRFPAKGSALRKVKSPSGAPRLPWRATSPPAQRPVPIRPPRKPASLCGSKEDENLNFRRDNRPRSCRLRTPYQPIELYSLRADNRLRPPRSRARSIQAKRPGARHRWPTDLKLSTSLVNQSLYSPPKFYLSRKDPLSRRVAVVNPSFNSKQVFGAGQRCLLAVK